MDAISLSLLDIIAQNEQSRLDYYAKCEQYYDGDHPLIIPEKYRQILKEHYNIMANYCAAIVDAPVSRLKVESIVCEDTKALELLNKVWKYNRMDAKCIKIHRNAVKKGDAFVQVWPHFLPGNLKPDRYDIKFLRPDICFPFYSSDDDESLEWVKKQWIAYIDGMPIARKDIFYPDRIERYYAGVTSPTMTLADFASTAWIPYDADGQESVITNPFGKIPIVHFRNREDDSPFGTSELHNAFAVQNGINKLIIDLLRTADFQAWKQRYVIGVDEEELPLNPDTCKRELQSNPGDVWRFPQGEGIEVGELSENDPQGILNSIDKLVDHLCTITRTPKTVLQDSDGTASSGFALAKVEAPLIDKCQELQVSCGNGYEDVNGLIITMMQYYNDLQKGELPETSITWKPLTTDSPSDKLSEAQRKQLLKQNKVISARQWAIEEGYTDEEITRMQGEMKSESESETADLLGHGFSNSTEE